MRRFGKVWLTIAIVLVLLVSMTASVQAQDDLERLLDLTELRPNVPEDGVFEGNIAARLYSFLAEGGDTVTITMIQSELSTLDPFLVLIGGFGEVLAYDDDGSDRISLAAQIDEFEIPFDGRYYLLATDTNFLRRQPELDTSSAGSLEIEPLEYTLELKGAHAPEANSIEPLFLEEMISGDAFEIEISPEFPIFFAIFEADEDDALTVSALSDEVDTLLMVFGATGNRIAVNDDIGPGNYSSELDSFRITRSGPYLLLVTGYGFEEASDPGWTNHGFIDVELALD